MKILGIIPARGGSKGIPRKNIKALAGKPLLAYTSQEALKSQCLSRVILSTEDDEIATVGRQLGLEVPFLRPCELSLDDTPSLLVIQHALRELQLREDYVPDLVVILQPTSPFRTVKHIDESIRILLASEADSLVSVVDVPHNMNPNSLMRVIEGDFIAPILPIDELNNRRQTKPKFLARNGAAVYVCRTHVLLASNSLFGENIIGYRMSKLHSIDIDDEEDWFIAEVLKKNGI